MHTQQELLQIIRDAEETDNVSDLMGALITRGVGVEIREVGPKYTASLGRFDTCLWWPQMIPGVTGGYSRLYSHDWRAALIRLSFLYATAEDPREIPGSIYGLEPDAYTN